MVPRPNCPLIVMAHLCTANMEDHNLPMRRSSKKVEARGVPGGQRLMEALDLQAEKVAALVPICNNSKLSQQMESIVDYKQPQR